jgi:hypothetical protein
MLLRELILDPTKLRREKYKGKPIAFHFGGYTGTKIPDELKPFFNKHIKTSKTNGQQFVSQYQDDWYDRTLGHMGIHSFHDMAKFIRPYFTIVRSWTPSR